jgi:hypothetical protein
MKARKVLKHNALIQEVGQDTIIYCVLIKLISLFIYRFSLSQKYALHRAYLW